MATNRATAMATASLRGASHLRGRGSRSLLPPPSLLSFVPISAAALYPTNFTHPHLSSAAELRGGQAPRFSGARLRCGASLSDGTTVGNTERELLVQHLLVEEKDVNLLPEIEKRVAQGVDLSDLAIEYSICPSKESGGMLGWVRRGQMVPEFEEAAFSAPLNKIVRCKTNFGWHLLQVLSEREECMLHDIQPEELHAKLQDASFVEEAQLIDVREPHEVDKASLPGFKVLPLRQFGTWGPMITDEFDPRKDTYVMCHHGMRSMQVAKWLQSQGFRSVFNVAGGIHAYALKADSSVPTY